MATATLTEPDVITDGTQPSTFKRRARRLGTITTALAALIALGISFAFFVSNEEFGNNEAEGGELQVTATGLAGNSVGPFFPTNDANGGASAEEFAFSVDNANPATVRYVLEARCDVCDPDSDQQAQWDNLIVVIEDAAGAEVYRGRIADMNDDASAPPAEEESGPTGTPLDGLLGGGSEAPSGASSGPVDLGTLESDTSSAFTATMWLQDSGEEQPQGVINAFSFLVAAQTV